MRYNSFYDTYCTPIFFLNDEVRLKIFSIMSVGTKFYFVILLLYINLTFHLAHNYSFSEETSSDRYFKGHIDISVMNYIHLSPNQDLELKSTKK